MPTSSPRPSPRNEKISKVEEIETISDDDENPPLPPHQPMTPPPPPPHDDEDDRPPRLHRPKPTDPRLNRYHPQQRPPSPATILKTKEETGRQMGLDSYVVESVVRHMSNDDWYEFLTKRKYGRALIQELQAFLNEKYCNEEHTAKQQQYGQLCNKIMYPLYFPPYERDLSARHYHMQQDGEVPSSSGWSMVPQKKTFLFRREFADGSFPVYVSDEEYDRLMFEEHEFCVEDHTQPTGYYETHTLPENPAKYALRTINSSGNEVVLQNTPRK